jgi:uncharacterized protein YbjT (DUF2867 family)
MIMKTHHTLVLGSTGKTGRRVAGKLTQLSHRVRPGSRSADIPFFWEAPSTWVAVLKDIDSVYVTFQPDLAMSGAVPAIKAFAAKAVEMGIKKLVLLSGRGEPEAQECEKLIMEAGVNWTIVRASWFCQNFSESHMLEPILAGYVALPAGDMGEPFIDVDDIADVVVAALTEEGHDGQLYEVSGPRLLSFREAVEEIAAATGKPIHYQEITIADYSAVMASYGVPEELIALITYLFSEVLDGRNAVITDGVERALGRRATDFSDYVRKAMGTGVWKEVTETR